MREKALRYLGLMRKAGLLEIGEASVGSAIKAGKACLLLMASDAGENARHRARSFTEGRHVGLVELPFDKDEISRQVGKGNTVLCAVTDKGFAVAFMKALAQLDPEYEPAMKKLGTVRKAHSGNTATRRNNA